MKLVEKAVCFECGDWVRARVQLPAPGSDDAGTLVCPVCGTTRPRRPTGPQGRHDSSQPDADGFFAAAHVGHDCTVVAVGGEIDISTAVRFRDVAVGALATEPRMVVLELTGVTFMDSTGLAVLIQMRRRTGQVGIRLAVVGNERMDQLLHVSGLQEVFETYATLADATSSATETVERSS